MTADRQEIPERFVPETTEPRWLLRLVGAMAVVEQGEAGRTVDVGGHRLSVLFATLALSNGHALHRYELADVVWPEGRPSTWSAGLRNLLSELRRTFAQAGLTDVIRTHQGSVSLKLPADAVVDLDQAALLVEQATSLADPAARQAAADRAMVLLDRTFLADHHAAWITATRNRICRMRLEARSGAAESSAKLGHYRRARAIATAIVADDPTAERGHQLLIGVLLDEGDRAAAATAYESCCRHLANDLALLPSATTTQMIEAAGIATQWPALARRGAARLPWSLCVDTALAGIEDLHGLDVVMLETAPGQGRTHVLRRLQQLARRTISTVFVDATSSVVEVLQGAADALPTMWIVDDLEALDGEVVDALLTAPARRWAPQRIVFGHHGGSYLLDGPVADVVDGYEEHFATQRIRHLGLEVDDVLALADALGRTLGTTYARQLVDDFQGNAKMIHAALRAATATGQSDGAAAADVAHRHLLRLDPQAARSLAAVLRLGDAADVEQIAEMLGETPVAVRRTLLRAADAGLAVGFRAGCAVFRSETVRYVVQRHTDLVDALPAAQRNVRAVDVEQGR